MGFSPLGQHPPRGEELLYSVKYRRKVTLVGPTCFFQVLWYKISRDCILSTYEISLPPPKSNFGNPLCNVIPIQLLAEDSLDACSCKTLPSVTSLIPLT